MDEKSRQAMDEMEWQPPVESDSFETYEFTAEPFGSFPSWGTPSPYSEIEPDGGKDRRED